jgi:hypothetical protein
MKVILSESQVNRSVEIFNKLMNANKYEHVCRVIVDYDEEVDRYLLNIIFDKNSIPTFLSNRGEKNRIIRDISERFLNWTGQVSFLYSHYEKCS